MNRLHNLPPKPFPFTEEARQAIIEHNRLMKSQREWERANRARLDAEWDALPSPPRTIAAHLRGRDNG
jgi:hypothetical protein